MTIARGVAKDVINVNARLRSDLAVAIANTAISDTANSVLFGRG